MNRSRIVLGGIMGGLIFNLVSFGIHAGVLAQRYEGIKPAILRQEPRLPFLPVYALLLIVLSMGLVWLYAAARPRLGAGPRTALAVGLVVGLIAGLPGNLAQYAWSYVGGFISMWWAIEMVAGCTLATLAGAWLYKE
ncbi:MAG: hypothetical protein ACRDV9_08485 [Acidimicrobiia bacterium]